MSDLYSHTPGPWTTDGHEIFEPTAARPGCGVAKVNRLHEEHGANARLIAAAPDMLAELRWIALHLEVRDTHNVVFTADEKARIIATIAKATGGEA